MKGKALLLLHCKFYIGWERKPSLLNMKEHLRIRETLRLENTFRSLSPATNPALPRYHEPVSLSATTAHLSNASRDVPPPAG